MNHRCQHKVSEEACDLIAPRRPENRRNRPIVFEERPPQGISYSLSLHTGTHSARVNCAFGPVVVPDTCCWLCRDLLLKLTMTRALVVVGADHDI